MRNDGIPADAWGARERGWPGGEEWSGKDDKWGKKGKTWKICLIAVVGIGIVGAIGLIGFLIYKCCSKKDGGAVSLVQDNQDGGRVTPTTPTTPTVRPQQQRAGPRRVNPPQQQVGNRVNRAQPTAGTTPTTATVQPPGTKAVFSFGSNNLEQVRRRVRYDGPSKKAMLKDYERIFFGTMKTTPGSPASVKKRRGKNVKGKLVYFTPEQERKMDGREGVFNTPPNYKKEYLNVVEYDRNGNPQGTVQALVYVKTSGVVIDGVRQDENVPGEPCEEYLEKCIKNVQESWGEHCLKEEFGQDLVNTYPRLFPI